MRAPQIDVISGRVNATRRKPVHVLPVFDRLAADTRNGGALGTYRNRIFVTFPTVPEIAFRFRWPDADLSAALDPVVPRLLPRRPFAQVIFRK
jgi:hypothetical protein